MDVSENLLFQGLYVFLFCIALTVLFYNFNSYMFTLNEVRNLNKEQIIFEEGNDLGEDMVSRAELISYMMHQLEYNIEVDGVVINKTDNIRGNIQNYNFHSDFYRKGYRYQRNGTIETIVFFGM